MKHIALFIILFSIGLSSCTDDDSEIDNPKELAIGDFYKGGIIFYLDITGDHGLVCDISDYGEKVNWGCYNEYVDLQSDLGKGSQNTQRIMSNCGQSNTAPGICSNMEINGYNDWFLPSQQELQRIYDNREVINRTSYDHGGRPFINVNYWSSSSLSSYNAYALHFGTGKTLGIVRDESLRFRAVRAF